jgi:hypothetical protein
LLSTKALSTNRSIGLMRRIKRYWTLPRHERLGLPAAFVLLGLSRLAILVLPFKTLVGRLGDGHGTEAVVPVVSRSALQHATRIGWVVRTAARWTPWTSNCFAQSLTSAVLLQRAGIPHAIYFGLAKNDQQRAGLDAHAWVATGPRAVVGGHSFDRFVVVGCWLWSGAKPPLPQPAAPAHRRGCPNQSTNPLQP